MAEGYNNGEAKGGQTFLAIPGLEQHNSELGLAGSRYFSPGRLVQVDILRLLYYSNGQNHNEMYYSNAQDHYEMYHSNAQSRNDPCTGVWTNHHGLIFLAPL